MKKYCCCTYKPSQGKELLSSWFYVTETGTTKSHRANIDTLLFRQSDKRHQHHAERSAPCLNLWRKDGSEMNVLFELEPAILWSAATTWIWASFYGWINFANIFYWWYFGSLLDRFKVKLVILLDGGEAWWHFHSIFAWAFYIIRSARPFSMKIPATQQQQHTLHYITAACSTIALQHYCSLLEAEH